MTADLLIELFQVVALIPAPDQSTIFPVKRLHQTFLSIGILEGLCNKTGGIFFGSSGQFTSSQFQIYVFTDQLADY